jgi:predicted transcriptional regulator
MDGYNDDKTLRIEIRQASDANSEDSTSRVEPSNGVSGPRVKCVSAEQVMRLISGRNLALLRLIKERQPQSLAELSRISGRPTASLTRTLQRLSALGIVRMESRKGREKTPVVACDRLRFELPLTA